MNPTHRGLIVHERLPSEPSDLCGWYFVMGSEWIVREEAEVLVECKVSVEGLVNVGHRRSSGLEILGVLRLGLWRRRTLGASLLTNPELPVQLSARTSG